MTGEPARTIEQPDMDALLSGYLPQPGVYDEMVDASGALRPHWRPFVERLAAEGPHATKARFDAADRYLRESGVFYRVYDDPSASERAWPLSHVPLLISPEDWKVIEAGVVQRARLVEAVLADCYGAGRLVHQQLLPATVVAGSPEYLRPLVHARPAGGKHLFLYAVDLCRSPTGQWWVVRDRTQAPSGAGYALENRIALSRSLSDIFRSFEVERLAQFFDRLRETLGRLREPDDAGVCLLTPGPLNETYFEHTYLARYLGLRLVEGADLMVQGDEMYLRTIAGLRKVRVLLRRIDSDFADPLELNARSQLGVAGLVQAVRQGNVTLANAVGSGLAESRALMGFLPALAGPLLGESLKLPNVATWWCGQAAERETVLARFDELVIASAFSRTNRGIPPGGPWTMAETSADERASIRQAIERRGIDFVGQEPVKLSTTPVWVNGRLEPHPFTVRVFVAATTDGYKVMPGGFAVIGDKNDPRAVTMQKGARSADVWVLSDGHANQSTLLPTEKQIVVRRATGALPSRSADNLFWLARYIERTEATLRLIRALAARVVERRDQDRADLTGLGEILFRWGAVEEEPECGSLGHTAQAALCDLNQMGAVPALVRAARRSGLVVRDRFPPDAWRALEDLNSFVHASGAELPESLVYERASSAQRIIAAVTGFQLENMNRRSGWRFLKLGQRIERAISICRYVRQFAHVPGTPEELDVLLDLSDTQITYRGRYPFGAALAPVLDLVLLDDSNPRSLTFQLGRIREHCENLPLLPPSSRPTPALGTAKRLLETVLAFDPARIKSDDILGVENALMQISDEISLSFLRVHVREMPRGGVE